MPDDWDRLIAPMGYEPLAQFLLPAADTGAAAACEGAAPAVTAEDGIKAPLSDGDYRLVPSMALMTEEGRICLANGGAVSAWAHGADGPETLVPDGRWAALLDSLFTGCSFTVSGGQATAVTLRPQAGGGHVTGLDEALIAALGIRLETVPRQSREAGKATPDGASMILSVRISSFSVDLGGPLAADPDGTPHFLTLDGDRVTLDPRAETGASATLRLRGGGPQSLTFTRRDSRTVSITYSKKGD